MPFEGRAEDKIKVASLGQTSALRCAVAKILVGKPDSLHELLIEFVLDCIRVRVALAPEELDEPLPFLAAFELKKNFPLGFSHDRRDNLEPFLVLGQKVLSGKEYRGNKEK